MKTEKMIFKNIKDVLSRDEMKKIMAGSGGTGTPTCQAITAAVVAKLHDECYQGSNNNAYQLCMFCGYSNVCGSSCA